MTNELRVKVERLHKMRLAADEARDELKERTEAFNLKNKALIATSVNACGAVQEMEDEIRADAVKLYEADPRTKDIAPGVTIYDKFIGRNQWGCERFTPQARIAQDLGAALAKERA